MHGPSFGLSRAIRAPSSSRLRTSLLALLVLVGVPVAAYPQTEVAEIGILELQEAMASGRATSVSITEAYLARIAAYDRSGPNLNAMVRLNPTALGEAAMADQERAAGMVRGPLHGIPVVVKESFDVAGLPTSAGSLAFAALFPVDDAAQVRMLRDAGAVILGKTSMDELAMAFLGRASLSGQTLNPYSLGRTPGGSSGGTAVAVAASLATVGWGTDACGSTRLPASHTSLVSLRTTTGISSTDGIFPLSRTMDVAAPMARTVTDLAIALDATVGLPESPSVASVLGTSFVEALEGASFEGIRIGLLQLYLGDPPETRTGAEVVVDALGEMEDWGAEVLLIEIPELQTLVEESMVVYYEFKWDLENYLASIPGAHFSSLTEVIASGLVDEALIPTLNSLNEVASSTTVSYLAALYTRSLLQERILEVMDANQLDAIAYPTVKALPSFVNETPIQPNCGMSSAAGFPAITMPAGYVDGLPVGLELLARPLDDAKLVALAYAFEQATQHRRPPFSAPSLAQGSRLVPLAFHVQAQVAEGGPEVGDEAELIVEFSWDAVTSRLTYDLQLIRVNPADVYAVVLSRDTDEGGRSVVRNLSAPGEVAAAGSVDLGELERERLLAGELYVEVFARESPLGVARTRIVLN